MEKKAKKDKIKLFEYDCKGFVIKPRWQLVSSHTARRTAITNMVLSKKWTDRQMMEVSGHKKYETFNKYVKLSLDDIADEILILYGGSVKPENITEIMDGDEVDGALVGGASLDPEKFMQIIDF